MKHLRSYLTFSNAALVFSMALAWKTEGSAFPAALMLLASLATKGVEQFYFLRSQQSESETLKKEIKALQDRMGRAELGLGIKAKL